MHGAKHRCVLCCLIPGVGLTARSLSIMKACTNDSVTEKYLRITSVKRCPVTCCGLTTRSCIHRSSHRGAGGQAWEVKCRLKLPKVDINAEVVIYTYKRLSTGVSDKDKLMAISVLHGLVASWADDCASSHLRPSSQSSFKHCRLGKTTASLMYKQQSKETLTLYLGKMARPLC